MAVEVAKVELKSVQDASGLEERILAGQFTADQVVAVVGKTEGNGGVNDFTRILADQAFRRVLLKHGKRSEAEVATIPMVWSGGCDGVITPHATVFARNDRTGPAGQAAPGDRHRHERASFSPRTSAGPRMVEIVAEGVQAAMKNAGIDDPKDVHYVQTKTPLLTIDWVEDAQAPGQDRGLRGARLDGGVERHHRRSASRSRSASSPMPRAEQICKDLDLYSSVASCSSGVELTRAQIILMGNKAGAGGRYRIGHSVMKDALDIDGIYAAIRNAGLELPERPRAEDLKGRARELLHQVRRPTTAPSCAAGARSCSTTPTSTTIATPRRRSAAWRRPRSAIRRSSSRSTRCTRDRTAAAPSSRSSTSATERAISRRGGRRPRRRRRAASAPAPPRSRSASPTGSAGGSGSRTAG